MKLKLDYAVVLKYTNNQSQEQICQMKTSPSLAKPLLNQFQQRYQVFFWLGLRHFLIFLTGTALWRVLYLVKYKNLFHEKSRMLNGRNYQVIKTLQKKVCLRVTCSRRVKQTFFDAHYHTQISQRSVPCICMIDSSTAILFISAGGDSQKRDLNSSVNFERPSTILVIIFWYFLII